MKTQLEFGSKDSESSSYKGATGAAPGRWQTAAEELGEESEPKDEADGPHGASSGDLLDIMRGLGHMQANDSGWPTFYGRYASYPRFKKEWKAYRETYHSAVNNDLAAKALRDKCIKGDALRMVSHLDNLQEIWETLDTCYERLEKYMEEALRPIVDFRRYKITDSAAVREFYSLLRAAIKGAKGIGRLSLLINDQTVPKIMSKMPYTDWKEWATKRPDWMQENLASAFERFVERKWQDALNVAAAEPLSWNAGKEKSSPSRGAQDKATHASNGAPKVTGAVNVVKQEATPRPHSPLWDVSFDRKCRAQYLIGCDGDHVLLQCNKLLGMKLSERKEILKKSGLCLFCLKHAAELECYGRGGFSKPKCTQAGCDGEHTPGVHKLLGEESVGVNLVAEGEYESEEDEEWWVGTVRMEEMQEEGEETLEEMDELKPEREVRHDTSIFMRKDDSGLEDEFEYLWEAHVLSDPEEPEEDRWWSPEPLQPSSEEDEDEVQYLAKVLGLEPRGDEARQKESPALVGVMPCPEEGIPTSETSGEKRSLHPKKVKRRKPRKKVKRRKPRKKVKRRKPRKKVTRDKDQEWERARQDAWLREMLTDTSESEAEEKYARFAESGRWIAEMTGTPQQTATTSRGECSGQEMPDS